MPTTDTKILRKLIPIQHIRCYQFTSINNCTKGNSPYSALWAHFLCLTQQHCFVDQRQQSTFISTHQQSRFGLKLAVFLWHILGYQEQMSNCTRWAYLHTKQPVLHNLTMQHFLRINCFKSASKTANQDCFRHLPKPIKLWSNAK